MGGGVTAVALALAVWASVSLVLFVVFMARADIGGAFIVAPCWPVLVAVFLVLLLVAAVDLLSRASQPRDW